MSVQGAVIHWVADHRKHHTFTDEEGDPHSPHTHGAPGWRGVLAGPLALAHGLAVRRRAQLRAPLRAGPAQGPDDAQDRPLFPVWALLGLVIPFVLGFALSGGSWVAGLTAFVWAGLVRVFLLHHATWSVNSICHMYGKQPFSTEDESRNNWAVALVSLGEGWHHSHHAFPTSARHGLQRLQFDPSYALIKLFERLGWATNVKHPKPDQIEAKRRAVAEAETAPETADADTAETEKTPVAA